MNNKGMTGAQQLSKDAVIANLRYLLGTVTLTKEQLDAIMWLHRRVWDRLIKEVVGK